MAWMVKETLMVFLFLETIECVLSSPHQRGDIVHFIVSFLLVVGGWGHLPLLHLALVYTHLAEFRPHMLKTHLIES